MVDSSNKGLRQAVHVAHQNLLVDPTSPLTQALGECNLQTTRALLLQQSADFSLRFDLHYNAFPRQWFTPAAMFSAEALEDIIQRAATLPACCVDTLFTQRLLQKWPSGEGLPRSVLQSALKSISSEDSACCIVENERQHGRLRAGYGKHLQGLRQTLAEGYLMEWQLEHADRGFGHTDAVLQRGERLRTVIKNLRVLKKDKERRGRSGNAKLAWVAAQDL
eukprot:2974853-Amphidinium_carterae.1